MLAVVLSLAAAAAFAASAMFIDSVSGRVGPLQLSRWQMSLAFLMTAAIVAVTGGWQTLDLSMVLWLTASSASGDLARMQLPSFPKTISGFPRYSGCRANSQLA